MAWHAAEIRRLGGFPPRRGQPGGKLRTDAYFSLYWGCRELFVMYVDSRNRWGWRGASRRFFSGQWAPDTTGQVVDHSNGNTLADYDHRIEALIAELMARRPNQPPSPSPTPQPPSAPAMVHLATLWTGKRAPSDTEKRAYSISQGWGMTMFARNHVMAWNTATGRPGMYYYTREYSRDRQPIGHAAIDVGMPVGVPLYALAAGVVIQAGGTGYNYDEVIGPNKPQSGDLRIQSDNGDIILYSHCRAIEVRVGHRVEIGGRIGTSGTMLGGHVHLEYRRKVAPNVTISGYECVDPFTLFDYRGVPIQSGALAPGYTLPPVPGGTTPLPPPPSPSWAKPTPPPAPPDGFGLLRRTVTVGKDSLRRRTLGRLTAPETGPMLTPGSKQVAVYIVEGDAVEGNNRWYVLEDGSRAWSGGFVE